jgi:hypothetical protein
MAQAKARGRSRARSAKRPARGPKYVYAFANGKAEGSSALRDLLGGKGCELAEMTNLGIPVPPGFTITTEAWRAYVDGGKRPPARLWPRSSPLSRGSRPRRISGSAIPSVPSWFRFAPARAPPCRA